MKRTTIILASIVITIVCFSCKDKDKEAIASFQADKLEAVIDETITFTNNSSHATHYQWDFGDESYSIEENPTHSYAAEGTYTVKLEAIGSGGSSTSTQNITVSKAFETSIFEGVGITGLEIGDTWGDIKASFTSDTSHFVNYNSNYSVYFQIVYFVADGIAVGFITETAKLGIYEPTVFIYIFAPYVGGTAKGIGIGSTLANVKAKYGTPEDEDLGEGVVGYWYDSKGIDFYSYDNSEVVDEIDIYRVQTSAINLPGNNLKNALQGEFEKQKSAIYNLMKRK